MWLRRMLIAAAVVAPLAFSPMDTAAQQRGQDRAATAQATNQGRADAPEGLVNAFAARTPPAALVQRFPNLAPQPAPQPDVQPEPEPEPQPEPEPCSSTVVMINFQFFVQDCNGNLYPL